MDAALNALVLIGNYIVVPGLAYGSQLALGALGVTMIYAESTQRPFLRCAVNGAELSGLN